MVKTNDVLTYYEIRGRGYPLILIHGGGVSQAMWNPQVRYFSPEHQVVTYDVRGHGRSQGSAARYSCALFADDLKALLDRLGISRPVVCGFSLGGMIAQEYAVKYPNALAGLILADTAASAVLGFGEKLQNVLLSKHVIKLLIRCLRPEHYVAFVFGFFRKMKPSVRAYLMQEELRYRKEELLKLTDAVYDFHLLDLSKIRVPTLILYGEWESPIAVAHARLLQTMIQGACIRVVRQAGHATSLENPGDFNRAVDEFLTSVVGWRPAIRAKTVTHNSNV
jgi:pimeloyl-ACP methyl ester carboxylesterase